MNEKLKIFHHYKRKTITVGKFNTNLTESYNNEDRKIELTDEKNGWCFIQLTRQIYIRGKMDK